MFIEHRGIVTSEEFLTSNLDLANDPRSVSISFFIIDLLGVTDFTVSSEVIRTVAMNALELSERNSDVKVAIILQKDLIRGFARMYELSGAGNKWDIEIFKDRESAFDWPETDFP